MTGRTLKVSRGMKEEDEKQRKLEVNRKGNRGKKEKKRVSFEGLGSDKENWKKEIEELAKIIENKRAFNEEVEKRKKREEEWLEKEREWEERIKILKERMEKIEKELERKEEVRDGEEAGERGSSRAESKWGGSAYSMFSGTSRLSEDRLSVRELDKIKRLISNREREEREERKNNVVIKGLDEETEKEVSIERVEAFFKDKLDTVCKVEACWRSGKVVVVKLEKEEEKLQVLRNKSKLKGKRIFIKKDLTWEERRVQEKINKWVREERSKGMRDVKIGKGRIRIDGI